jgi:hypothetical protein
MAISKMMSHRRHINGDQLRHHSLTTVKLRQILHDASRLRRLVAGIVTAVDHHAVGASPPLQLVLPVTWELAMDETIAK